MDLKFIFHFKIYKIKNYDRRRKRQQLATTQILL